MVVETPTGSGVSAGGVLLSLEAALERMLDGLHPLPVESMPLEDTVGLVVADPLDALVTVPPWDNTAMDGFAVRAEDVRGAHPDRPVLLTVTGDVAAGHAPAGGVGPGTAMRILTGAVLPAGADAVVPLEETDAEQGIAELPDVVAVREPAERGAHVRRAGSDVHRGDRVHDRGKSIRPAAVALLAATGHALVPVHRRPRVAVLSTGDELVPVGRPLGAAQIHDSNSPSLAAQARSAGAEVRTLPPLPDTLGEVLAAIGEQLSWADVVVVSGGVSVGARDVVKEAFDAVGRMDLWRVAVQPGKPLAFGRAPRAHREGDVLLFGLPGNPVSSFVTFELFVRPVLRVLAGHADPFRRRRLTARLAEPVSKSAGRRAFLRVALEPDPERPDGRVARLAGGQGSHVLSALALAHGLAVIPEEHEGLPAGTEVEVWELDHDC